MSHPHRIALADRKALLMTRAELDRARVTLAVHQIKSIVVPAPLHTGAGGARSAAAIFVNVIAPLLGAPRLTRVLRFVSIIMMVSRIARKWK